MIIKASKICTGCKIDKPIDEFHKSFRKPDGRVYYCKECEHKRRTTSAHRKVVRNRYYKDRKKHIRYQLKYQEKNPKKVREYYWRKWGVIHSDGRPFTYEDFLIKLDECGHKCEICDVHESDYWKKLIGDHNHQTGVFRGILCNKCNLLLGKVKKDPIIAQKMTDYLKR